MNIHNLLFSIMLILLSIAAHSSYGNTLPKTDSAAAQFILNISDKIYKINSSSLGKEQKLLQLKSIIEECVDTDRIATFVLGRNIKSFSETQKMTFKKAYRNYLITKYSKLLSSYGGKINISNVKALSAQHFSVATSVEDNDKNKINVRYSIIKNDKGSFLIYDILFADDISLTISDRDEISGFIEKHGLDKLVQKLEQTF